MNTISHFATAMRHEIECNAMRLGIRLTDAETGSDLYEAWADRVELANICAFVERHDDCAAAVDDANRYAI